jgi:CheY-like chemotaxis protein
MMGSTGIEIRLLVSQVYPSPNSICTNRQPESVPGRGLLDREKPQGTAQTGFRSGCHCDLQLKKGVETLPLANCEVDNGIDIDIEQADPQFRLADHRVKDKRGKRILVIDDDPDLRLGLHIRLEANGYDTSFATNAESAVRTALAEMPNLVILDIGLPDFDGYSVMKNLSAVAELADVPVIVLSGRNRFTHEKRCQDAGVKRFFKKPVDDRRLLRAIRELLG